MTQPIELSIPAELHKQDVGAYAPMRGCTNRNEVTLGGVTYEPDTLRFLSFFGKWDLERRLLVGTYRFQVGKFPDGELANLQKLPNLLVDPQPLVVAEVLNGTVLTAEEVAERYEAGPAVAEASTEVTDDEEPEAEEVSDGV